MLTMMDTLGIHPLVCSSDPSDTKQIATTGGPCAGKSTILARATQKLSDMGITTLVIPEIPTEYIVGGASPGKNIDFGPFQEAVLLGTIEREYRYHRIANSMKGKRKVILSDRGRMDGLAYMSSEKSFFKMAKKFGYDPADLCERPYAGVLHLRSVAVDAPHLYTTANNAARRETVAEAAVADEKTLRAWNGHPHFRVIPNLDPRGGLLGLDGKFNFFIKLVASILGVPVPLEIENKYLLRTMPSIPKDHQTVEIVQFYINGPDGDARIRSRTWRGVSTYYFATKIELAKGVRCEVERLISASEFAGFMRFVKPESRPVTKLRKTFVWKNQYFELDVFTGFYKGLILLEIELTEANEKVRLPSFITKAKNVTGDSTWSNFSLSQVAERIW